MKNVYDVVNQIQNLPTLPQVVTNVVAMAENPETSSTKLAKVISSDAALVSKILKVVNSAYYGLPRKVSTLTQATIILGFNTIKNLVLTASVFSIFDNNKKNGSFDRRKFWEHSLGCAIASKIIAKRIRLGIPEEAFVAGLIHDLGKIVLDQFLNQKFMEVLRITEEKNITIQEAEREVLGVDHTQIGEWLCDKWNFPRHIQESVAYHHSINLAEHNKKLVAIVHLADAIAKIEGLGYSGDTQSPEIDLASWQMLDIREEELNDFVIEIHEEFENSSVFFELGR